MTFPYVARVLLARVNRGDPANEIPLDEIPEPFQQIARDACHETNRSDAIKQSAQANGIDPDELITAILATSPDAPITPNLFKLSELGEYAAPDWLIKDIYQIPSLNIFYGESGGGKTWMLLEQAYRVSRGEDWQGIFTHSVPILIIDTESGKRRITNRVRAIEYGGKLSFGSESYVVTDRMINLNVGALGKQGQEAEEHKQLLKLYIAKTQARFVLIDAFADIAQGADENAAQGVMPTLNTLREIANDCNCAIVCIHHTNRNGSSKGGNYRGSSAIKGAVDVMMQMETVPTADGFIAKLETVKQRDGKPITLYARATFAHVVPDINNPHLTANAFSVACATEQDFDTEARAILEVIATDTVGQKEISDRLEDDGISITSRTLKRKLTRLVKDGALQRQGKTNNVKYWKPTR